MTEEPSETWARRSRSFGRVAAEYDRFRPDYPDELFTEVLAAAPGGRVLEAGAGTGRATLALARRGAAVVAVEPSSEMAALARRATEGLPVEILVSSFEQCTVGAGAFDLVVAAQAWHWVDPAAGAAVAARALRPGGAICLWWNRPSDLDGPVWEAIDAAYAQHAPDLDRREARRGPAQEETLEALPGFSWWTVRTFHWDTTYTADEYCGLVQTRSDHVQLPLAQRERLIEALRSAVDGLGGGWVRYRYRTVLLTARPHENPPVEET